MNPERVAASKTHFHKLREEERGIMIPPFPLSYTEAAAGALMRLIHNYKY